MLRYGKPGSVTEVLSDVKVTAYLDSQDKTVSGNDSCNNRSVKYSVDKVKLSIAGPFAIIVMRCAYAINKQEPAFLEVF